MKRTIHKIDYKRLRCPAQPIPAPTINEPQATMMHAGLNVYWCDNHPELFGQRMSKLLLEYPPDVWDVRIVPGIMPGETWTVVATRKEPQQ